MHSEKNSVFMLNFFLMRDSLVRMIYRGWRLLCEDALYIMIYILFLKSVRIAHFI